MAYMAYCSNATGMTLLLQCNRYDIINHNGIAHNCRTKQHSMTCDVWTAQQVHCKTGDVETETDEVMCILVQYYRREGLTEVYIHAVILAGWLTVS